MHDLRRGAGAFLPWMEFSTDAPVRTRKMPPHPGPLPASGTREIIDARARARTALPERAACEKSRLAAAEAFELGGGPGDRLIDRLALDGALGDHFCCRRLRVNLVGDAG